MTSLFIAARALTFAALFMWLWFWVILQVQPLSRAWDAALPPWIAAPGVALAISGAVGILVCIAVFVVRGRGTPAIFDAPRQFVVVGPYRYVRNPMYLSAVATFYGVGLYVRSFAVLAFAAAWFLAIHLFVRLVEEPGLHHRFGSAYDEYRRRVPRWLPRAAIVLLLVSMAVCRADAQPAPQDFSGTWALNLSRSDYGPFPSPERRTDVIDHRDPALKVTRREVPSGGQERTGDWSCSTTRIECINRLGGNELKSLAHWDGAMLVIETKTTYQGQDAYIEDRWTLSPDRQVLTITRHAVSPQGTADQTFVLERRQ